MRSTLDSIATLKLRETSSAHAAKEMAILRGCLNLVSSHMNKSNKFFLIFNMQSNHALQFMLKHICNILLQVKCCLKCAGFTDIIECFVDFIKVWIKGLPTILHPTLDIGSTVLKVIICHPVLSDLTQAQEICNGYFIT